MRFSPMLPGVIGWPSACNARIRSSEKRHSARSGPPWCSRSRWTSPSSPRVVTRADDTARFGTPPDDRLICAMRATPLIAAPRSLSSARALDHPFHRRVEHELAALVGHLVPVGDDAAIGLLGIALLGDRDAHADGVAFEHRRD